MPAKKMKQGIAILMAAAVLLIGLCACGTQSVPVEQTSAVEQTQTEAAADTGDDVALPQERADGDTTTAVIAQPSSTAAPSVPAPAVTSAVAPTQLPETATQPPETATQPPETATQPPETATQPPETATQPSSPKLLQSSVLDPIRSGTYTETISGFTKDKSTDDKLTKVVKNGSTAYSMTIPAAGYMFKVFPADGKYYLATSNSYCELTKSQYDAISRTLNGAYCDFSSLQYQGSEDVREGLRKNTREDYTAGGATVSLWYNNGSLYKMDMATDEGTESLPITVSGKADERTFALGEGLEEKTYSDLESYITFAEMFFAS